MRAIDIKKVLERAGKLYAEAEAKRGFPTAPVITNEQVKAGLQAVVDEINKAGWGQLELEKDVRGGVFDGVAVPLGGPDTSGKKE